MYKRLLVSLGITSLISGLFALIFINHWWLVFALTFVLQIVVFYFINTAIENNLIEKAEKIKIQQYVEANKQVAIIECPCGDKNKQEIVMRFDKEVTYICGKCEKNIKAVIDVRPILVTEPIYFKK